FTLATGSDGAKIESLTAKGGTNGIRVDSAVDDVTLSQLEISDANYGIEIHNSAVVDGWQIVGVDAHDNGVGIRIRGTASGLSIDGSSFDNNGSGLITNFGASDDGTTVDGVTISNTTFNDNVEKGLYIEKLSNATFTAIEVSNSGQATGAAPHGFEL